MFYVAKHCIGLDKRKSREESVNGHVIEGYVMENLHGAVDYGT